MALHPSVVERLARLAPDQRAAATAPPGPVLCIAPAGSGKTTTLVARIAWLVSEGADPSEICAVTFNKRAADELGERLATALEPLGLVPGAVRVRTFHALGREILRSAGRSVEPLVDRGAVLRSLYPRIRADRLRVLDDAFSRFKLEEGIRAEDIASAWAGAGAWSGAAADAGPTGGLAATLPVPGQPELSAFVAYQARLAAAKALDFDDLVVEALRLLETDAGALAEWRRACTHLLVDEVQDVDRTQLRLAIQLAAPAHRIFLVGDDDQSIYGWRLADVRRVLSIAEVLPGVRRVDLVTNYRCPRPVVHRAVRLIAGNRERFVKEIQPRAGAAGRLTLAAEPDGELESLRRFLAAPLAAQHTRAVLARTNRELLEPVAVALDIGVAFRAPGVRLLIEDPALDEVLDEIHRGTPAGMPLLRRLGALEGRGVRHDPLPADPDAVSVGRGGLLRALLGWAPRFPDLESLEAAIHERRRRLETLRRDDAPTAFATVHGTKGLEFDEVAVIGLTEGRFPSARSVGGAADPARAMEEERRLAYVAWTRARRSLTLIYDRTAPSPFLLEAFTPDELGLDRDLQEERTRPNRASPRPAPRGGGPPRPDAVARATAAATAGERARSVRPHRRGRAAQGP
ncbi:MAG TPA: ATP-dependent helicase [Candidatus Saccharimonadales bacterium]|nr:ATP-dependent helicase [Candidatus Saccharimonadales bacterium]